MMNVKTTGLGPGAVALLMLSMATAETTPPAPTAPPQAIGLKQLSDESRDCVDCHRGKTVGVYQAWGSSKHHGANVGCYECHRADPADPDAFTHFDYTMSIIVSPKDCARCHIQQVEEFLGSHHSKGGRILGSVDNLLGEVVEGNNAFVTPGFPHGNSAAAVSGCWQCHGSQVKILDQGVPDPATWPNTGIGRINPDGSEGTCIACHPLHRFTASAARHPDVCGRCHLGPDHPQKEIYEESKHGIMFAAHEEQMNIHADKWVIGEDYFVAPVCATCHVSATRTQPVTHDIGRRISWNNRPTVSVHVDTPELPWQKRRANMQDVCTTCHSKAWVNGFYTQYDAYIDLYNGKYAKPGLALMAAAKPLLKPTQFSNKVDWTWWELWHHEGRRGRHGASMMGPDYAHWHGTYHMALAFYSKLIPELEDLVDEGLAAGGKKARAAETLRAKIEEVLSSDDHKWYLGRMDPQEAERRAKAAEEFKRRYQDK